MCNRSRGATLALVIVCTLVLVLMGIFAFFAFQMLGGGRQTESAADAGGLNVAKVAVLAPTVQLNPNNATYGEVDLVIKNLVLNGSSSVNLLNFNKIVTWGLLVAANADADGNQAGKDLARKVWMRIEGDQQNSLGAQLKAALSDPTSSIDAGGNNSDVPTGPNWAQNCFNQAARANSTLFANSDQGQQITWTGMDVGYLGRGDSTNITGAQITNNLPYKDPLANKRYTLNLPVTGDGFIQGYTPITVGDLTYYFVTVYHDQNPGLRSNDEYSKNTAQPGADAVALPPNTFYNRASIVMKKSNTTLAVASPATVGTKAYPTPNFSYGYLVLDNSGIKPDGTAATDTYVGPTPGSCNDVTCAELGQGIYVLSTRNGGQLFSTDQTVLNNIKDFITNGGTPPSVDGVYNFANGSAATAQDIQRITGPVDPLIICTDQNSDASNPNADPLCKNQNTAFNNAYHPGGTNNSQATINGLTGVEVMKDVNFKHYSNGTSQLAANLNTGLAQYTDSANPIADPTDNIPWGTKGVYNNGGEGSVADQFGQLFCCPGADWVNPDRIGKITKLFSLAAVFDQTTVSPPNFTPYSLDKITGNGTSTSTFTSAPGGGSTPREIAYNFFRQRCTQLGASQSDIDSVWNNTKVDVGEVFYVFRDAGSGALVATKTAPAGVTAQLSHPGAGLDGTIYRFYKSYNVFWNVVNAQNDFNVHDRLWTQVCSPGVIQATDSAMIEAGSGGLGGALGRLTFHQHVDNGPGQPPTVVMTGEGDPLNGSPESVVGNNSGTTMTGAPSVCEPD